MAVGSTRCCCAAGASRWLAAVAVAPVLLDAYEVQIEQTIMPDVWFEAMIVAGLAAAALAARGDRPAGRGGRADPRPLGHRAPGRRAADRARRVLPGGRRGKRAAARSPPWSRWPWPSRCRSSCTAARPTCTTVTSGWPAGRPRSAGWSPRPTAPRSRLPPAVRPLCPTPREQANGPDWLEHSKYSPLHTAPIPAGASRARLVSELTSAIKSQQPLRMAGGVVRDPCACSR